MGVDMSVRTHNGNGLSPSLEDYLEAIEMLEMDNGGTRVSDISKFMKVKKPSVTGAIKTLSEKGLIEHERYGRVELTGEGRKVARSVKNRHDVLIRFLVGVLGIDPEIASGDACRMEHTISPETFKKLTRFMKNKASGKKVRS